MVKDKQSRFFLAQKIEQKLIRLYQAGRRETTIWLSLGVFQVVRGLERIENGAARNAYALEPGDIIV